MRLKIKIDNLFNIAVIFLLMDWIKESVMYLWYLVIILVFLVMIVICAIKRGFRKFIIILVPAMIISPYAVNSINDFVQLQRVKAYIPEARVLFDDIYEDLEVLRNGDFTGDFTEYEDLNKAESMYSSEEINAINHIIFDDSHRKVRSLIYDSTDMYPETRGLNGVLVEVVNYHDSYYYIYIFHVGENSDLQYALYTKELGDGYIILIYKIDVQLPMP